MFPRQQGPAREITVWKEVPGKRLEDIWWQRTDKFWQTSTAAPPISLYRRIALPLATQQ